MNATGPPLDLLDRTTDPVVRSGFLQSYGTALNLAARYADVLTSSDVVIGISDSGQTTAVVEAMRLARAHGAATIGVTSVERSALVAHADVAVFTSTVPGSGLYGESVTSKWGQLLVIDALYATYASRHFDETLAHLEETYTAGILHSRSS